MARTRFRSDAGLVARMSTVMLLLGALYVTVFVAIAVFSDLTTPVVLFLAAAVGIGQWYFSDKLSMRAMRAREVSPEQAPELHGMIDRLCVLADMPKPRVAVAHTDIPNAFATGRSPQHSVVCVTTGLMRRLDREELEGVLSHELSHVAHRDVTVMTVAGFLGVAAGLVMRWGLYFGGGRRDSNALPFLVIWLGSIVVYLISFLLTRVLSRYRELSADRAGAYLTGKPSALASALTKISGDMARIPTRDLRQVEGASAFLFAPAINRQSFSALFATHPPLERRLEQLAQISGDLSRPTG
ncbi:MAG: Probable protease htpX homolog 1 [uncultured Nocardioidaceae bacterium]|uniref:Protease HtpX homolog n=1 Tax=uncultured Nocardioidaceae bacterium TaxID=253824 RepID=A0A6J4MUR7_9ACTN|nr:MAG: Probable protease htpX homolog 1 [uncultured Nocardioidaceae bacterium]